MASNSPKVPRKEGHEQDQVGKSSAWGTRAEWPGEQPGNQSSAPCTAVWKKVCLTLD